MGMSQTMVGRPVKAHNVDVTAESMPPETPTTNPFMPASNAYVRNQSTMWACALSA
jgi:hypothetical protein